MPRRIKLYVYLCRMLGINSATLSRFMSGKTVTITNENLVKIADIFNVSTDYLLGRTDIKDKMNHAASELGLSTEVAQNLYIPIGSIRRWSIYCSQMQRSLTY